MSWKYKRERTVYHQKYVYQPSPLLRVKYPFFEPKKDRVYTPKKDTFYNDLFGTANPISNGLDMRYKPIERVVTKPKPSKPPIDPTNHPNWVKVTDGLYSHWEWTDHPPSSEPRQFDKLKPIAYIALTIISTLFLAGVLQ